MARIRTVKPEFWTDEKVVELSPFARLLFIGLWNFADDEGRLVYSPKRLKLQIFPADDLDISELFGEIRRKLLVQVYEVDNVEYLQVAGFSKHQKIDKRSASKLPHPPNSSESLRVVPTEGIKEGIKEGKGKDQGKEKEKPLSGVKKKETRQPTRQKLLDTLNQQDADRRRIGLNDLTVKMFEDFAKNTAPNVNLLLELERFRDHWRSRGRVFNDNSAAFRNWLRKAQEFHDERKGNANSGANGAECVEISPEERLKIKARQVSRGIRTTGSSSDSAITSYDLEEMLGKNLITQEQADRWG